MLTVHGPSPPPDSWTGLDGTAETHLVLSIFELRGFWKWGVPELGGIQSAELKNALFPQRLPGRGYVRAQRKHRWGARRACPYRLPWVPCARAPFPGGTSTLPVVHVRWKRGRPISTKRRRKENIPGNAPPKNSSIP